MRNIKLLMKQGKHTLVIFTVLIGLIMSSCKKENVNIDITSYKWEVIKIKKQGESSYIKANESYVLELTSDTTFNLKLDVNNCFGHYEILSKGNMDISKMGCTEICCDSEFAEDLLHLFPKMTKYYEKGAELIFEGQGEIILKQH